MRQRVIRSASLLLLCIIPLNCLTFSGTVIGKGVGRPGREGGPAAAGALAGFVGDLAVAVKAGGLAGGVYGLLALSVLSLSAALVGHMDYPSGEIEYPVYPATPEGRKLRDFVAGAKNVIITFDKPAEASSQLAGGDGRLARRIVEEADKESFYFLLDGYKRTDILPDHWITLQTALADKSRIALRSGTQMILHLEVKSPLTRCDVEPRLDKDACSKAMISAAAGEPAGSGCAAKPTAVRLLAIPVSATLIHPGKEPTLSAAGAENEIQGKVYAHPGDLTCPAVGAAVDSALHASVVFVKDKLFPAVKVARVKLLIRDPDPAVEEHLALGAAEIRGETPSFEKAAVHWRRALEVSKGKSEAALADMGHYHFSRGECREAADYYDRASQLEHSDKRYWQEMKKRMQALVDQESGR
ncbi:MAG: hypothetical protein HY042_13175 [Spirochaetia bacterium]|nr:hypothetical protein [Spirochaetia bacterium]